MFDMKREILFASILLISGCSKSPESVIEELRGQKIDCSFETIVTGPIGFLRDSYLSYQNDNVSSLEDGEYIISIESKYKNGNFEKIKVAGVPYLKKGSAFSPKIPGFWDQAIINENDVKRLSDANGQFSCTIRDIARPS